MSRSPEHVEVLFPLRGRGKVAAPGDTPTEMSTDIENMRTRDPQTGELRGAKRSGLSKFAADAVSGSKPVRAIGTIVSESNSLTFEDNGANPDVEWARATPANARSRRGVQNADGEVIVLSGDRQIAKFNPDGVTVWTIEPTLPATGGTLLALDVDDFDNVYTGSLTGQTNSGRIFAYREESDTSMVLQWQRDITGQVSDLHERNGRLYAMVNDDVNQTATVVAFADILSSSPNELWRANVPYPGNQIRTTSTGTVIANCLPATRPDTGEESFCGTKDYVFQPMIDKFEDVTFGTIFGVSVGPQGFPWAHFDAAGTQLEAFADGSVFTYWPSEVSGSRDLTWTGLGAGAEFQSNVLCGRPGVYLDGQGRFASIQNTQNPEDVNNKNWVPYWDNGHFIVAMLVRPNNGVDEVGLMTVANREASFHLTLNDGAEYNARAVFKGSWTPTTSVSGSYDEASRLALVVFALGGDDFNGGQTEVGGHTGGGFFRVNGVHVASFINNRDRGAGQCLLGGALINGSDAVPADFVGHIIEVQSFALPDRSDWLDVAKGLEGAIAHRAGAQSILPVGHPYKAAPPQDGTGPGTETETDLQRLFRRPEGIVLSIDASSGEVVHGASGAGIGYGLDVDKDDNVICTGPEIGSATPPNPDENSEITLSASFSLARAAEPDDGTCGDGIAEGSEVTTLETLTTFTAIPGFTSANYAYAGGDGDTWEATYGSFDIGYTGQIRFSRSINGAPPGTITYNCALLGYAAAGRWAICLSESGGVWQRPQILCYDRGVGKSRDDTRDEIGKAGAQNSDHVFGEANTGGYYFLEPDDFLARHTFNPADTIEALGELPQFTTSKTFDAPNYIQEGMGFPPCDPPTSITANFFLTVNNP